ncbi:MAG: RNase adapter RapZ [Deferribacteraceae bacterium]|nr:RNase adapter RapZ [Deferribacteraceae bacterium]
MFNISLVIITGMSGAGKSVTAKAAEDMGYYTIDNMPLMFIERFMDIFIDVGAMKSKIALVIDSRSGDGETVHEVISMLRQKYSAKVIFLSAATNTLVNRYKENRRKHPLGDNILEAINKEGEILLDIKSVSDLIVDTSDMNVHELNSLLNSFFQEEDGNNILVSIKSFGFKYGVPVDSDLLFDVRFLRNPHFVDELRGKTGQDKEITDYVMEDSVSEKFFEKLCDMLVFLIPKYQDEGKRFLNISIGCTGGRHRSVVISELLTTALSANEKLKKMRIQVRHRDVIK